MGKMTGCQLGNSLIKFLVSGVGTEEAKEASAECLGRLLGDRADYFEGYNHTFLNFVYDTLDAGFLNLWNFKDLVSAWNEMQKREDYDGYRTVAQLKSLINRPSQKKEDMSRF